MNERIPRNLGARQIVKGLASLGYEVSRQRGSHIRLTTQVRGEHHVSLPNDSPIRLGTLHSVARAVARHHGVPVEQIYALFREA